MKDKSKKLDFVLGVDPPRLNERLAIQNGKFLFPANLENTFEQNLCVSFDVPFDNLRSVNSQAIKFDFFQSHDSAYLINNVSIVKINLPSTWHNPIMVDLGSMNIDAASLFPGLDGFARSLQLTVKLIDMTFTESPNTPNIVRHQTSDFGQTKDG